MNKKLSKSLEDYLEAILIIQTEHGEVRVKDLMDFFDYKVSSVNQAIKQLKARNLVEHQSYKSVKLTTEGTKLAKEIYNKHKTLVTFLYSILGTKKEIAEHDACSFEHFIHKETLDKLEKLTLFLKNNPTCLKELKNFLGENK